MSALILTKSTTPIIGQAASLLGFVMDAIYNILSSAFGIQNIGLCIILFTFVIYLAMLPLTIRQQKFSKLSAKMNPEIQAVQKKYKNKKDQASVMKMQEETKAIYAKYGTSPTGGCLQLLIQFPILLGLYRVIMNIPAYVGSVKEIYEPLVKGIQETKGFEELLASIGEKFSYINVKVDSLGEFNSIVDVLYQFRTETWAELSSKFSGLGETIASTSSQINHLNNFLGINIAEAPISNWKSVAILIPILAGLSQFLSVKLMPQPATSADDNPMAGSMKTMNLVMPIFSMFMCFTLPAGLGLYWTAGAVIRSIQQIVINKYFDRTDVDELVAKNMEKANQKREKKGLPANTMSSKAKVNVRNIDEPRQKKSEEEKKEEMKKSTEYYNEDSKPGSLTSKANMVKKFNESKK